MTITGILLTEVDWISDSHRTSSFLPWRASQTTTCSEFAQSKHE